MSHPRSHDFLQFSALLGQAQRISRTASRSSPVLAEKKASFFPGFFNHFFKMGSILKHIFVTPEGCSPAASCLTARLRFGRSWRGMA
jgi:hypothetical protein